MKHLASQIFIYRTVQHKVCFIFNLSTPTNHTSSFVHIKWSVSVRDPPSTSPPTVRVFRKCAAKPFLQLGVPVRVGFCLVVRLRAGRGPELRKRTKLN